MGKYCLFVTGTPIMSRAEDIYGIISIKDETYFGKYKDFEKEHLIKQFYKGQWVVVAYKGLDELRDKVQNIVLRRTESEVDIDLPETIPPIVKYCKMDKVQETCLEQCSTSTMKLENDREKLEKEKNRLQSLYDRSRDKDVGLQLDTKKAELTKVEARLKGQIATEQVIANSPLLLGRSKSTLIKRDYSKLVPEDKYVSDKVDTFLDIVDEILANDQKAIVFSKYETVVLYLQEILSKNKVKSVCYTGKMKDDDRDESIRAFQEDEDVKVFIGTDAAAEGWTKSLALAS